MTNTLPKDRHIEMVFQNYALFQNMTVWESREYGFKMKKEKDYDEKIKSIIDMVELNGSVYLVKKENLYKANSPNF